MIPSDDLRTRFSTTKGFILQNNGLRIKTTHHPISKQQLFLCTICPFINHRLYHTASHMMRIHLKKGIPGNNKRLFPKEDPLHEEIAKQPALLCNFQDCYPPKDLEHVKKSSDVANPTVCTTNVQSKRACEKHVSPVPKFTHAEHGADDGSEADDGEISDKDDQEYKPSKQRSAKDRECIIPARNNQVQCGWMMSAPFGKSKPREGPIDHRKPVLKMAETEGLRELKIQRDAGIVKISGFEEPIIVRTSKKGSITVTTRPSQIKHSVFPTSAGIFMPSPNTDDEDVQSTSSSLMSCSQGDSGDDDCEINSFLYGGNVCSDTIMGPFNNDTFVCEGRVFPIEEHQENEDINEFQHHGLSGYDEDCAHVDVNVDEFLGFPERVDGGTWDIDEPLDYL